MAVKIYWFSESSDVSTNCGLRIGFVFELSYLFLSSYPPSNDAANSAHHRGTNLYEELDPYFTVPNLLNEHADIVIVSINSQQQYIIWLPTIFQQKAST